MPHRAHPIRYVAALFLAALTAPLIHSPASTAAPPAPGKEGAIEGEVVDTACYLKGEMRGEKHQKCAAACSKDGIPTGIVDAGGKMYTILAPSPGLADYQAAQARITGVVYEAARAIEPKKIEIKKDGKWVEVPVPESMM
jgi:hypothetical protein